MTRMAAAKDSDSGIGIGRDAGINAPYYEYGYGLCKAGSAASGLSICHGAGCLRSVCSGQASQCPIHLYTCMFMMSW